MNPIRVLLADDHAVVREALASYLESHDEVVVVGSAASGAELIERASLCAPDLILLDIAMPDMNGIEAARRLRVLHPSVKIVALSAHTDKRYVLAMLEAGAQGYVVKSGSGEELLRAIHEVTRDRSYLSPEVAGTLIDSYRQRLFPIEASAFELLGAREREVIQLLAEGGSSKEIASKLGVSARTVETHRRNIMRKLDLHSVAALTKYAVREGLTSLE